MTRFLSALSTGCRDGMFTLEGKFQIMKQTFVLFYYLYILLKVTFREAGTFIAPKEIFVVLHPKMYLIKVCPYHIYLEKFYSIIYYKCQL